MVQPSFRIDYSQLIYPNLENSQEQVKMYNLGDYGSHQINSINIHSGETVISLFSVVNTL